MHVYMWALSIHTFNSRTLENPIFGGFYLHTRWHLHQLLDINFQSDPVTSNNVGSALKLRMNLRQARAFSQSAFKTLIKRQVFFADFLEWSVLLIHYCTHSVICWRYAMLNHLVSLLAKEYFMMDHLTYCKRWSIRVKWDRIRCKMWGNFLSRLIVYIHK